MRHCCGLAKPLFADALLADGAARDAAGLREYAMLLRRVKYKLRIVLSIAAANVVTPNDSPTLWTETHRSSVTETTPIEELLCIEKTVEITVMPTIVHNQSVYD